MSYLPSDDPLMAIALIAMGVDPRRIDHDPNEQAHALNVLRGLPKSAADRRYVGAMAHYGTSQKTVPIGVGRMFVRVDDTTLIGVDAADYANGGLP